MEEQLELDFPQPEPQAPKHYSMVLEPGNLTLLIDEDGRMKVVDTPVDLSKMV